MSSVPVSEKKIRGLLGKHAFKRKKHGGGEKGGGGKMKGKSTN